MPLSSVRIIWKLVPAAVVLVVLAGCGPTPAITPSPTPKPTETVASSPTPSPSETRTTKPALGELIATPDGIADSLGPVLVGISQPIVVADPAIAIIEWDDTVCDELAPADGTGGWKPAYPFTPDGKYPFFPNMTDRSMASPVQWISIQADEIRTAEGLGIGSSVAELQAEYGADLVVSTSFDYTAYSLHGSAGQLIFWTQLDELVVTMDVQSGTASPEFSYHTTPCG